MGWLFLWSIVEHPFTCVVSISWTRKLGKSLKLRTYHLLLETICLAILKYFLFVLICNFLTKSYIYIVVFCKVHDLVSKNDFLLPEPPCTHFVTAILNPNLDTEIIKIIPKGIFEFSVFFAVNHLRKMWQLSCFVIIN